MTQANLPPIAPRTRTNGFAVASLVLGVLSVLGASCCCGTGLIPAVLAIIFGHIGRGQIRRTPGAYEGGGMALAGLICGYVALVIQILSCIVIGIAMLVSMIAEHTHHMHCPVM